MPRRDLSWIVLLSAALHIVGIVRAVVPAQDGLKFIRVAREFGLQPWSDVVRGSDQHPLYSIGIALFEPATATLIGPGPDAWRIAAQAVSAVASVLLLFPLFALTRRLFDEHAARLACLLFAVLPATCAIGHDTLSDSLALALFTGGLLCGESALRTRSPLAALGCGVAAGAGYWTRPEVAVLPVVVLGVGAISVLTARLRPSPSSPSAVPVRPGRAAARWPTLAVSFLAIVGAYALVKGEVSEKLAVRRGSAIAATREAPRAASHGLPPGLDNPRFDFAPKEESGRIAHHSLAGATMVAVGVWAEGLGWVFAPMGILGALLVRSRSGAGRRLVAAYVLVFGAILTRHAMGLGYLSGRHGLTLVVATLPWAAAGTLAVAGRFAHRMRWEAARAHRAGRWALAALVVLCVGLQLKPAHASRWGHRAAGRWLAEHATEGDAVLDTRGWAAFVSGLRAYDPWHIRQALTDARLAYVVVGADELEASSRRAETLRALLAYAAEPVAAFPEREGGPGADVRVYRFRRPASWEGIRP